MTEFLIITTAMIAAGLTYYLSIDCKQGAVRASAALSLLFALFLYIFPNWLGAQLSQKLAVVFIGASFVGMSGQAVLKNIRDAAGAGLIFSLLYLNASRFFSGYGGGLGTMAFIAVLAVFGLQHYQLKKKGKMNSKKVILIGLTLLIALFSVAWWMNQINEDSLPTDTDTPTDLEPITDIECGMENCHGLEISCGPNIAEVCTMVYMPGDGCRQYANCAVIDGKCQVIIKPEFELCKSCVENCQTQFAEDPEAFFACESDCINQTD
jgi:hypothetical protein